MKKLVPVLVIAMVLALAFTVAANAEAWTPQTDGLYDFTFDLGADKTGTMYGMVVIEAADDAAAFTLNEDNIRYIDQVTANGNTLSFTDVGPMDLQDGGKYYVYIGGGDYTAATKIGTLSETGTTPEPPVTQTFTVTFVADDTTVDTITKNVGETVAATEFPAVPVKEGYTGAWNVTSDITSTTTVTAVYTAVGGGSNTKKGDIDGSGKVNSNDAIYLLECTFDDELPVHANTDVDGSGKTNSNDAIYLLEYTFDNSLELH